MYIPRFFLGRSFRSKSFANRQHYAMFAFSKLIEKKTYTIEFLHNMEVSVRNSVPTEISVSFRFFFFFSTIKSTRSGVSVTHCNRIRKR